MIAKAMAVNWVTSLVGIGMILTAVGGALVAVFDGDPKTTVDLQQLITTIIAALGGMGLIAARDAWVSSRASGAK